MATDVMALTGASVKLSDDTLQELASQLRGPTVWGAASRPGLAPAAGRPVFNAMHPGNPAVHIECSGTADVIDAVRFARDRGLAVAVRGGGHSIAGLSSIDGGVLIDLAPMRGVQVDPERRLARVQGGALWGDVDRETQAFGLAAPGGVVSDTGVGGLTLGGGYGWVRRKHGLSCDNLLEAQVVLADGRVVNASPDSHPDLFWAIRGGGGNFGVVTSFTFALHPIGPTMAFAGLFYPLEQIGQVLRGFRDYTSTAPNEVTSVCVTITFPADPNMPEVVHNRQCAIVGGVYAGDPEEGARILSPLTQLGTPLLDISGPMSYTAVQTSFDGLFPRGELHAYWKALYLQELSDEVIDVIAERALDRPAPLTLVNTFHMGGAIADADPEDTAFAERRSQYMVSIDGIASDAAQAPEVVEWVRDAFERINHYGTGGIYLNFTGSADEAPQAGVDSAFGRNLRRLQKIKATYDPENFFRRNNNIRPVA